MNKQELVSAIAEKTEKPKKETAIVVDLIIETITEALANGDEVSFAGFGKFKTLERAARTGRNPQTGEEIEIEAKVSPKFVPSKALKELINS